MASPGGKITVPALHSTKKVYKAEELTSMYLQTVGLSTVIT